MTDHRLRRRQTVRQTVMAAITVLAAGAATSLVAMPGASAQTNSRLCGRYWTNKDTQETVIRLYEVRKSERATCNRAAVLNPIGETSRSPDDAPWKLRPSADPEWRNNSLHFEICEDFKEEYAKGRDWAFEGSGWPGVTDQNDICLNMNRSDTLFEMETYWLYDDGSHITWKFQRA